MTNWFDYQLNRNLILNKVFLMVESTMPHLENMILPLEIKNNIKKVHSEFYNIFLRQLISSTLVNFYFHNNSIF